MGATLERGREWATLIGPRGNARGKYKSGVIQLSFERESESEKRFLEHHKSVLKVLFGQIDAEIFHDSIKIRDKILKIFKNRIKIFG